MPPKKQPKPRKPRKNKYLKIVEDTIKKYDGKKFHVLEQLVDGRFVYIYGKGRVPKIGKWQTRKGPLQLCSSGTLHYCNMYQVVHWFDSAGHVLFEVETEGPFISDENKFGCLKRRHIKEIGKISGHSLYVVLRWLGNEGVGKEYKQYANYLRKIYLQAYNKLLSHDASISILFLHMIEQPFEIFRNKK